MVCCGANRFQVLNYFGFMLNPNFWERRAYLVDNTMLYNRPWDTFLEMLPLALAVRQTHPEGPLELHGYRDRLARLSNRLHSLCPPI